MSDQETAGPREVDWSTAEVDSGALPPDRYLSVVDDIYRRTRENGEEYWGVKFAVKHGDFQGRFLWDNWFFSPKGLGRIQEVICPAFGVAADGSLNPEDFKGKSVILEIINKPWEGKPRSKVTFDGYEAATELLPF